MLAAHPHRARRSNVCVAVLAAALLAAGCTQTARSRLIHGGPLGASLAVGEDSNGKLVHVRVGERVVLTLSDFWSVEGTSAPAVLRQDGATVQLRGPNCPPGLSCNPERTEFTALTPGTAVITATRTTCGEALRCEGPPPYFALTVIVA